MSNLKPLFIVACAALMLSACGGGGSTSDSGAPVITATTASVGIIFTDSSAVDAALVEIIPQTVLAADAPGAQLLVTVTSVELKGASGDQTIFSGTEIIDLYDLKDSLELFFVNESVTPGTYDKIRLHVDSVSRCEPVPQESESALEEVDCDDVKLPSGKIDFNPRESFTIAAGDVVIVTLDIDANKSLKLTENPRKIILRPVVFVDIDSEPAFEGGLVRVSGVVAETAGDRFRLCSAAFATPLGMANTQSELNEMCLDVLVTLKTGLFDDEGLPVDVSQLMKGDPVTVIGLLQLTPDGSEGPTVTPLAEGDADAMPTPFQIVAVVVEGGVPGTWERYLGILLSPVEPDSEMPGSGVFKFQLAGDEPPVVEPPVEGAAEDEVPAEEVPAILARVYEKTRIFAVNLDSGLVEIMAADLKAGDRSLLEAVEPPKPLPEPEPLEDEPEVEVDGLRVSLMLVLQDEAAPGPDLLRGKIESVTPDGEIGNSGSLSVISDETANAVCVNSYAETAIYLLIGKDDSIEAIKVSLGELRVGDRIAVAGDSDGASGCFDAALMIAGGPINP